MGSRRPNSGRISSSPACISLKFSTIIIISLVFASLYLFLSPFRDVSPVQFSGQTEPFNGDLRDAKIPWNKLCFGSTPEKLKLAVFSKAWPIGAAPGGMERHAATLYRALAARGHEIHVFTVPSDRNPQIDTHDGNLHVYFAANDHGSLNCSLAFDIFNTINAAAAFDYIHTESVSLPHWRAKPLHHVAVTWHGIWYEIMHSKLFGELFSNPNGGGSSPGTRLELQEAMPRLVEEIRFFSSYTQHICISNSAADVLIHIYQLPKRNVHVILNGVDDTKFVPDPVAGAKFRQKHGIPANATLVVGVAGRLVRDKGHPLLFEALSMMPQSGLYLLVAGEGPWGKRYEELGQNVKVLGALDPGELSDFYNALDIFLNPTLRPQGLDLTLIEAMHCGKPVLAPNYPSIVGTAVVDESFGYTFSPNVKSLVEAMKRVVKDGKEVLRRKGIGCKNYVDSMFTSGKMASSYERFFLCMKNSKYCQYPLPRDC